MFKSINKKRNNKGFTLVELLVVIAIIGVLAVVAVPTLFKQVEKSNVASLEADISAIKSAAMSKYADGTLNLTDTPTTGVNVDTGLSGEIEGLAKKIKGNYMLKKVATANVIAGIIDDKDIVLEITPTENFSDTAMKKLASDLGLTYSSTHTGKNGNITATSLLYRLIDIN